MPCGSLCSCVVLREDGDMAMGRWSELRCVRGGGPGGF